MKIDERVKVQTSGCNPDKGSGLQQSGAVQFGQILQKELAPGSEKSGGAGALSGNTPCPACEDLAACSTEEGVTAPVAAERLTEGLGKLEALEKAMEDSTVGLRSLDEMFKGLSASVAEMEKDLTGIPAEHPIRMIADELKVLSYVESIKWRRGDYL